MPLLFMICADNPRNCREKSNTGSYRIRSYLIMIICVICVPVAFTQNKTIDSLKAVLKNAKHDTTSCAVLHELIEDPDNEKVWEQYNDQLLQLAEKNAAAAPPPILKKFYLWYLAVAFQNRAFQAQAEGDNKQAIDNDTKALQLFKEIKDTGQIAVTLNNIGATYSGMSNMPKALKYYKEALQLMEKTHDEATMGYYLNNLGFLYDSQGDVP